MASPAATPSSFEIKSANLPLVVLWLKSTGLTLLKQELKDQYGPTPGFFDNDPVVIDLSHLSDPAAEVDFAALIDLLAAHRMKPIGVKGAEGQQAEAALASGLLLLPEVQTQKPSSRSKSEAPPKAAEPLAPAPAPLEPPAPVPGSVPQQLAALVVDKPLRSGQQVYARGRDLVVLAMVNPGAEVIADGHVHVYAPLRGKAIAGARGNTEARIFAQSLEAELISIAGVYRTSDVPLPADVMGKPATVRLVSNADGEKLVMEPIKG